MTGLPRRVQERQDRLAPHFQHGARESPEIPAAGREQAQGHGAAFARANQVPADSAE